MFLPCALMLCAAFASGAAARAAQDQPQHETGSASAPALGTGIAVASHVIAGGGGTSSGGIYTVSSTIGQVDADPLHPASGGTYTIVGGFWTTAVPGAPQPDAVFANGFEPAPP